MCRFLQSLETISLPHFPSRKWGFKCFTGLKNYNCELLKRLLFSICQLHFTTAASLISFSDSLLLVAKVF